MLQPTTLVGDANGMVNVGNSVSLLVPRMSARDTIMQFAIFGGARADGERPDTAPGKGFHDLVEFNVEAEALGYCGTFLVEQHFTGWFTPQGLDLTAQGRASAPWG